MSTWEILRVIDNSLQWFMGQGSLLLAAFVMNAGALVLALLTAERAKTAAQAAAESAESAWAALSAQVVQLDLGTARQLARNISDELDRRQWVMVLSRAKDLTELSHRIRVAVSEEQRRPVDAWTKRLANIQNRARDATAFEQLAEPYVVESTFRKDVDFVVTQVNALYSVLGYRKDDEA